MPLTDREQRLPAWTTVLTVFGIVSVSFMMAMYALERRGRIFIVLFALGYLLSSAYGFAARAWPFGVVELVWSAVALRRWRHASGDFG